MRTKFIYLTAVLLSALYCVESAGQDFIREKYRPLASMMSDGGLQPPTTGNDIEIIIEGMRKFDLLCADLSRASRDINIEYYRFSGDEDCTVIRDILCERSRNGVQVRFANENLINTSVPKAFYKPMLDSGIEIENYSTPWSPVSFLLCTLVQNHRKTVTIDGKVGYIGGMNIDQKYFHSWRDTHLRIAGPAVGYLQDVFFDTWKDKAGTLKDGTPRDGSTPQASPDTASLPRLSLELSPLAMQDKIVQIVSGRPTFRKGIIEKSYVWALDNAQEYIYIQSPYFVPTRPLRRSFKAAARRGVDVRIIVPQESDIKLMRDLARSYYGPLIKSGVLIYEKRGAFIHSKTFVTDDYLSCIGSANWDWRSLRLNYEDNAYIYDAQTALQCRAIWEDDAEECTPVTIRTVRHWGLPYRFYQKALRLLAHLF